MPIVSIIVPVFNTENYLKECLESLINQTYKRLEIICINDGSSDNSQKILDEYAKKDNRIKVYSQKNSGEAATRNRGLKLATGKYIAAIDSDDYCSLNFIEECVKLAENKNADIIIPFLNIRLGLDKRDIKTFSYFCSVQLFVKKELIDRNPNICYSSNIKMGPDAVFSHFLLTTTNNIEKEYTSKYFYRQHESQISNNMVKQAQKYIDNIDIWFDEITKFYNENELWEKYNNHLINFICETIFTAYLRLSLNQKQKKYLFNKTHNFISEHHLTIKFNYSNKRVKLFKYFLKCRDWKLFEMQWFIAHNYLKYIDWIKSRRGL